MICPTRPRAAAQAVDGCANCRKLASRNFGGSLRVVGGMICMIQDVSICQNLGIQRLGWFTCVHTKNCQHFWARKPEILNPRPSELRLLLAREAHERPSMTKQQTNPKKLNEAMHYFKNLTHNVLSHRTVVPDFLQTETHVGATFLASFPQLNPRFWIGLGDFSTCDYGQLEAMSWISSLSSYPPSYVLASNPTYGYTPHPHP